MAKRLFFLWTLWVLLVPHTSHTGEAIYELEGIVVTATRFPEKLREVPLGTRVITQDEIAESGARDMGELLRGHAGVDIVSYGTLGALSTVSCRGSSSSQVLVLLDGRPLNSISLGISDLSLLSLEGVERVEIVKGPISSLYGANALGGVVNIITKEAPENISARGKVSYGSFRTRVLDGEAGLKAGALAFLLSGSAKSSEGARSNSDYEGESARAKLQYGKESHQLGLSLGFEGRDLGVPGPSPASGEPPVYGDSMATSLFNSERDRTLYGDLSASVGLGKSLVLDARSYLDQREMDFTNVFQGYNPDWTTYRAELNDDYLTTTLGGNLQLTLAPSPNQKLVVGLDGREDRFEGTSELVNTETGWADTTNWNPSSATYGIWGETKTKVLKNLSTIGSLRYDKSEGYGSFVSPALGIVSNFEHNSLKLSAGRAFRAPTFNDLYWPGAGNPHLRPESGVAWEARLESFLRPSFLIAFSVFGRETKDLISWVPLEGGRWQPTNVDEFSEVGREVEIKLRPDRAISLEGQIALLSTGQRKKEVVYSDWATGETHLEYRTRRAAYIPKLEGSLRITYETPFGTSTRGEVRWVGERVNYYPNYSSPPEVTMDEKRLPAVVLLGGRVSQNLGKLLELFVNAENLLDNEYAEQFGNSVADGDYPRPGRTLEAGLGLSF